MVSLKSVRESYTYLRSTVSGQIAVFVGATSGIGRHTLTEYARHSNGPKIYIVGRSNNKLSSIIRELEQINPEGSYIPIVSEISLLKNVDAACEEFKSKEVKLDLLLMSPGYLKVTRVDNADGLEDTVSLRYYVRMRFIHNLLPLLTSPPTSRIVSIHGAGKEGHLIENDLELKHNFSFHNAAMHTCTMNTLALTEIATLHPTISCVHVFPGLVITGAFDTFSEDWYFPLRLLFRHIALPIMKLLTVSLRESGERNLFDATSARYPPARVEDSSNGGVVLPKGVEVANGWDWKEASGCYLLDQNGETTGDRKLLEEYRKKEMGKRVWEHTQEVFDRIIRS